MVLKVGDRYISGNIDLGTTLCNVCVFKNEKKEKDADPDFYIVAYREFNGKKTSKRIGALWNKVKKSGEAKPEQVFP